MLLPTRKIRLLPFFLLLLLVVPTATPVFALNFNAYWLYRQAGGETIATRHEFQQRYSLGVGPTLSYRPTSALSASGTVSYSRIERSSADGGLVGVDQLTPAGQIRLANDIFLAQLSGSNTRRYSEAGDDRSSWSWDATLGSTWQIPLFPSVQYNYGERTDDVESSLKTRYNSVSVAWDLLVAKLNYQYQKTREEDDTNKNLSQVKSHFARLESSGRLWNKRITYNFAQQFQTSTSNANRLLGQALSLVADPPPDKDQEDVTLAGNTQLVDRDRAAAAVEVPAVPAKRVYLELSFSTSQQVGVVSIYFDPLTTTADEALSLSWDIYVRDFTDTAWVRQASIDSLAGNVSYDETEHRLVLAIPANFSFQREIMVAADNTSGVPLTITEIEAGSALEENIQTSNTDYLTNLGLSARLTRTLNASANLTLERLNSDSGQASIAYDHRIISSRLAWSPVPYLVPSLGYSETQDQQTGGDEELSRAYSLIIGTIPLPTMHVTFGVTRTERYVNEVKTETSDQYSLYTKAQIYPDLTANLSLAQRYQESLDSEGQTNDATSFSSRLNLNARLTRAVIADFTTDYSRQRQVDGTTQNATGKLQLLYRPSELLALNGSYDTVLLGSEQPDAWLFGLTLTLLRTAKARLNLVSSYRLTDASSENVILTGSWDINRSWAIQTKANFNMADTYSYDFFASMTLRL